MGETLASHLNCVFIERKDKEVGVGVVLRALMETTLISLWVFKNFELGWLENHRENAGDEAPLPRDEVDIKEEEPVPVLYGWLNMIKNYFNPLYNLLAFVWSLVFTKEIKVHSKTLAEDKKAAPQVENEDDLYCTAPLPSHPLFPSVLELLDCDSPWLKKFLVDKTGIDKILVVPRFEDATSHVENIDSKYTLAGEK